MTERDLNRDPIGDFMPPPQENELLDPPKEKSRTCSNFEIFDHDPQLDIKFWNLTSNFKTHKNIGENFDSMYRYMYTLSMYP